MKQENKIFLISIKPQFANLIIKEEKTVELRKRFTNKNVTNSLAFIYASTPVKAIIAHVIIKDVLFLDINTIWNEYSEQAQVEKKFFNEYYRGK